MTDHDNPTARMPLLLRVTQVALMLVTGFLLGAHVIRLELVRVDAITLALIGILIVIPLADLVRKIKVGDFEAEIGKDEVAKAQAKAAVELPASAAEDGAPEARILSLLSEDPRLALAKVRIDLEESLKRLYSTASEPALENRRLSLGRLVDELVRREILSPNLSAALRDVIALANRAIHGETVERDTAEQLATLGIRLVGEINQLYLDRSMRPLESIVVTNDEVDDYRRARYRVTTVVPLLKNPTKNIYIFDQDSLESFLEGYEEYAEFVVQIERV